MLGVADRIWCLEQETRPSDSAAFALAKRLRREVRAMGATRLTATPFLPQWCVAYQRRFPGVRVVGWWEIGDDARPPGYYLRAETIVLEGECGVGRG